MSLERIAQKAGVSRATVSRVINNYPYVSDVIRERVLAVIAEEGFQPSGVARALAKQRTEIIGVIAPEGLGQAFAMPYFPILLGGISSAIADSEYVMALWAGITRAETERMYRRILGFRLMDGALILSSVEGDTLPRLLAERKTPMAIIGRPPLAGIASVDVDNFNAARAATEHLLRLKRTRIAHLTGNLYLHSAKDRLAGYRAAMETSRAGYDSSLVIEGDYLESTAYHAARVLVNLNADAVFVASDTMAAGLMRGLQDLGIDVPRQIALVGFDDLPLAATLNPPLTTMRQPIHQIGALGVRMLIGLVEGRATMPERVLLPTELIIRKSCGML